MNCACKTDKRGYHGNLNCQHRGDIEIRRNSTPINFTTKLNQTDHNNWEILFFDGEECIGWQKKGEWNPTLKLGYYYIYV